jgi:UDP-glucose 4-epimerase
VTPPRRLLVTGAAGFLGGAIVDAALADPATERVIALDSRPIPDHGDRRVVALSRDIRRPLDDVLQEIDAVFHAAFMLRASRDESLAHEVNVEATSRLLRACERAGVRRFVYPSSTTVYGSHPDAGFHIETGVRRPVPGFQYAAHKIEVEDLIAGSDLDWVVLRACIVLGPGTENFITESLGMKVLPVPAGADPPVQFLHRDDFMEVVRCAYSAVPESTYNVAGLGTIRWRDAVRMAGGRPVPLPMWLLAGLTEATWRMRLQRRSPGAAVRLIAHPWLADIGLAERELGWKPRYSSLGALQAWVGTV